MKKVEFDGNIFVAGCGAIAQCALPILLKELDVDPKRITVMDFVDNRNRIKQQLDAGVNFVKDRITEENYKSLLSKYLKPGDIFIDLAWNMDTCDLLQWCRDNQVRFVNSSVELWDPYKNKKSNNPCEFTLYTRHMKLRKMIESWGDNKGSTAIIDHGANPGLVSHFTKQALIDIAQKLIPPSPQTSLKATLGITRLRRTGQEKSSDLRIVEIEQALTNKEFARLAYLLDVKTIHISERDSQITSNPKKVNEFVNTWSIEGLVEEGIAPVEFGWGTHEKTLPGGIVFYDYGPKNQACLRSRGFDTWARSFVPSGEIIGMIVRHGEAFSISDRLTLHENGKVIYRPTVHYVYCINDSAMNSIHELKMRQLELQSKQRILNDDIIDGADELGCLLMGHEFKSWWIGSILDINEARKLVPHQNATTIQVAVAVVAAIRYLIKHPNEGVCLPDDIDYEEILEFSKAYLGTFISRAFDWSPLKIKESYFDYYNKVIPKEDEWQFTTFLIK